MARTDDRGQLANPTHQGYLLLRAAFTVAPILFGLDKFFNFMVDWPKYLAPWINDIVPGSAQDFLYFVGAVEITAGVSVGLAPWLGAYVVAAWLGGIVVNLLSVDPPTYYDIALRDFGLMLGALALGRLAAVAHRATAADAGGVLRRLHREGRPPGGRVAA